MNFTHLDVLQIDFLLPPLPLPLSHSHPLTHSLLLWRCHVAEYYAIWRAERLEKGVAGEGGSLWEMNLDEP